jgi:polysaccharide export outer membrane protein
MHTRISIRIALLIAVGAFFISGAETHAQITAALRQGDVFDLRMSGVPLEAAADFALPYTVDQSGTVNIPFIGAVRAAGLRPAQLERVIEAKLVTDQIFTRPTVVINVAQSSRHVSVNGGVRLPQRLDWSPDLTLSSSIGNCGGLDEFTKGKAIRLIREGKIVGTYNLKEIRKDPSKDPAILPGDQVVVPE